MSISTDDFVTTGEIVLEVMATARSMRFLREDPVDPALVERVIWAGTRASSPNNTQHWDFIVVTSPDTKLQIQQAIMEASRRAMSANPNEPVTFELPADPIDRRTALGAQNLLQSMHAVPVLIFVCGENLYPDPPILEWAYSAIFASAQNMLVAARALGLGAAFTTFHRPAEKEIRRILGLPDGRILGVTLPLGWPDRPFGPVTRRPVTDVIHHERW